MNRAEQWIMAKAITRYFRDVRNKDVFKKRILPLIQDFAGKQIKTIALAMRANFVDWVGEIDSFLKTLEKKKKK